MSYANDITGLAEDAVVAFLKNAGLTRIPPGQIYPGLDDEMLALPRVIVLCQDAERILNPDGNWDAKVQVIVRSSADDTRRALHRLIAGEVFSQFNAERVAVADAIAASLPGFGVDDILSLSQGWDRVTNSESRSWRSWTNYTLKCRGSD